MNRMFCSFRSNLDRALDSYLLRYLALVLVILVCYQPTRALSVENEYPGQAEQNSTDLQNVRTDAFYDSLQAEAERYWISRTLYPMVFSSDSLDVKIQAPDSSFAKWQGKTIRSIDITVRYAFSRDHESSNRSFRNLVSYAGNRIHTKTREWVIRENLFFSEGDQLDPEILVFNLVYLRKLAYLNQCNIMVQSQKNAPDSVDIYMEIKDNFSIKLGGDYTSKTRMRLNVEDQNFLGLGRLFRTEWHLDTEARGSLGYKLYYKIPNLRRTFIDTELALANLPDYSLKSIVINRPFLYPITKVAGGADVIKTQFIAEYDSMQVNQLKLGAWYGHTFSTGRGPANPYAYAAISLDQTWYRQRPEVGSEIGRYWHETLMTTAAIAITKSDNRYLPYVYTLLEDDAIPVGYLGEFLFGVEHGEFRNRGFLGLRGGWGSVVGNEGFLHLKSGIESFFTKNEAEQSLFSVEPLYITPLKSYGRLRGRAFYRGRIILGNKRFPQESVKLSTDPYFRGNRDLSGTALMALGLEEDIILPWNLAGFRFSVFGFVDAALVRDINSSTGTELITEGLGIRIRNPYLLWNSIELHGEWNQGAGQSNSFEIVLSTKVPIKMFDFEGVRPQPYDFR